ncbi:pentapeptide repeat-containing protein [Crossiella sp. CA198]|uniref:pentapeptide repeat-containing protein n=1 Tax=Crossiella sp. CA198 TaxID=3455607 RepID=UPI003F8D014C
MSAAVVVLAGLGIGYWLWRAAGGLLEPEATKARIEAIRTGLTTSAGVGAALALLLAVRRQRATEIGLGLQDADLAQKEQAAADVRHDAAEKRITELYTKAADQLGSDKAPVRLAGLYALERLGEGNPDHRQTVVNLFCAYLRMPYESGQEERQVRLTAQRILAWHLLRETAQFWPEITLDLSGAVLLDFTLSYCVVASVNFRHAEFQGAADFTRSEFQLFTDFSGARFTGSVDFANVDLARTQFDTARFLGLVHFGNARFPGFANFVGAVFVAPAIFGDPVPGQVNLDQARTRVGTDDHWPAGWIVQPPPREVEGRIEGLPGTWGYLTRSPDRHTE